MLFGGIFKIWSGGKSKARRIGIINQQSKIDTPDSSEDSTDNTTPGGDPGTPTAIAGQIALDRNNDGTIDLYQDLEFKNDSPGAATSFDGLKSFDTNEDNILDVSDPDWQKFGVWNDLNKDNQFQAGEFQTLAALGIKSISLDGLDNGYLYFQRQDGSEGALALRQSTTV